MWNSRYAEFTTNSCCSLPPCLTQEDANEILSFLRARHSTKGNPSKPRVPRQAGEWMAIAGANEHTSSATASSGPAFAGQFSLLPVAEDNGPAGQAARGFIAAARRQAVLALRRDRVHLKQKDLHVAFAVVVQFEGQHNRRVAILSLAMPAALPFIDEGSTASVTDVLLMRVKEAQKLGVLTVEQQLEARARVRHIVATNIGHGVDEFKDKDNPPELVTWLKSTVADARIERESNADDGGHFPHEPHVDVHGGVLPGARLGLTAVFNLADRPVPATRVFTSDHWTPERQLAQQPILSPGTTGQALRLPAVDSTSYADLPDIDPLHACAFDCGAVHMTPPLNTQTFH